MTARVLLIDNYDSFVFNLARYLQELGVETDVCRNDSISVAEILDNAPDAIVLSPGPCTPDEAGICVDLIREVRGKIPILGVCLGHQSIGAALGGKVLRAPEPVHGRCSQIEHDGTGLFVGCPNPLPVARYHSLIVDRESLPTSLRVTAQTADGVIMALEHDSWPLFGVQFHPESILTQRGHRILANFLHSSGIDCSRFLERHEQPQLEADKSDFYQREIDPTSY